MINEVLPYCVEMSLAGTSRPSEGEREIWRSIIIDGIETRFDISSFGRVRTEFKSGGYFILAATNRGGYLRVRFRVNSKRIYFSVHRLVATAFHGNPDNLPEVNHKDFDRQNNYYGNLEWSTKSQNSSHAGKNGKLGRGSRKLPPLPIGMFSNEQIIKRYDSISKVKRDGYARISVSRALKSGREHKGYTWKFI